MAAAAGSLQLHVLFYIVFLVTTAAASPSSSAAGATQKNATAWESDEDYWAKRAASARAYSLAAHASDPINQAVHRATTTDRRSLITGHHRGGPCVATNPIDRCWRCRPNWADDRQHLARCAMGFGHNALGGLGRKTKVVTDPSDDPNVLVHPKKGTLWYAVVQDNLLWIVFSRNRVRLSRELIVN